MQPIHLRNRDNMVAEPLTQMAGNRELEPAGSRASNNDVQSTLGAHVLSRPIQPLLARAIPRSNSITSTSQDRSPTSKPTSDLIPKRGRPKGSVQGPKPVVFGPRPRLGRPPGSGKKQKAEVLGDSVPLKRGRGRPKKIHVAPSGDSGISVRLGKVVVPGTSQSTSNSGDGSASQSPNPPPSWKEIFDFAKSAPQRGARPTVSPTTSLEAPSTKSSSPTTTTTVPAGVTVSVATNPPSDHLHAPAQQLIIPEEDPQRGVEPLDSDETSEAIGDGIGEEEEEEEDAEEDGDDDEEASEASGSNHNQQRRPLPQWLVEEFNERLAECRSRNDNNLPPLYSVHKTFWFPQKATYFLLRQNRPSPADLYERRMFLWDPQPLTDDGIPCPNCGRTLQRHGEIPRPRRCVDLDSTFWIIGYRYRCNSCINPKTNKRTVTFRSWNPRILKVLPPALAAEFPARTTHRSALSNTAVEWMRSCFQNGMGSKQFSDALRVQHLLRHDQLQTQYYSFLYQRLELDTWRGEMYEEFLPFGDISPQGQHGYIPSAQLLRNIYDGYIEEHQHDFNQHTAMLTGEICAIDHSHKITKHLARVEGEQVFTGLLTVTNEKGEIRTCNLVATKAQSQSELALNNMEKSLTLYGHSQPSVFFTDSISDKGFLERCFPSLRRGVVPIEKYGALEAFQIPPPPTIEILPKDTVQSIDNAARLILDDVPQDEGHIVVGFDTEWNVELSPHGFVNRRGKTAIVQIAYGKCVYIFQISEMISKGNLPHQLKLLLAHPRIIKVGRMVNSDLSSLQLACSSSSPFVGGLDLGKYAKDRHIVSNITKTTLSDLCALVLHKRLDKNINERISDSWENTILSPEQLDYAAKDAYASLRIYEELSKMVVPCSLPSVIYPSMPVLLYSADNTTVIAEGRISGLFQNSTYDGIRISPTRTVVDILKVLVPGAIVTTHRQRSLSSFGETPFSVACLRSHLRLFTPALTPPVSETTTSDSSTLNIQPSSTHLDEMLEEPQLSFNDSSPTITNPDDSVGALLSQDLSDSDPDPAANPLNFPQEIDPSSASIGAEILGKDPGIWDYSIHSRVLKDVWHVFHMLYISATHGLRKQFTRELRDAIFIPDKDDKARIDAWGSLQTPPVTYNSL